MTNQPYEGQQGQQGQQGYDPYWQQAYEDPHAAQQYTQQWQGQTWETQMHAPAAPRPIMRPTPMPV